MNAYSKIAAAALGLALVGTTAASAATPWQRSHPRRVEVNMRLANQSRRITQERREGELTRPQAQELRAQDRGIRAEERFDASRHHSHLTLGEKRALNRQENVVSREIGR